MSCVSRSLMLRTQRPTAFTAPSVVSQPFELFWDVEDVAEDREPLGTGREGPPSLVERDDYDKDESCKKNRKPGIEGSGH